MLNTDTIIVRPLEAQLTHDVELLGRMDPYVVVRTDTDKAISTICKDGGKNPRWTETMTLRKGYDNRLIVEVFNDNLIRKDKLVGACEIDLSLGLRNNNAINDWFEIFYNGVSAGRILLSVTAQPSANIQQGLGFQQGLGIGQGIGLTQLPNIQQVLHETYSSGSMIPGNINPTLAANAGLIEGALLQPQVISELANTGILRTNLASGTAFQQGLSELTGTTLLPGTTIFPGSTGLTSTTGISGTTGLQGTSLLTGGDVIPGTNIHIPRNL